MRLERILVATFRHSPPQSPAVRFGPWHFGILFALESMCRASIAGLIPIQAYDLLQDEQAVSILYVAVGIAGLAATISVPLLAERIARRRLYVLGALALAGASAALASFTLVGQAAGMFLRIFGTSTLAISFNLYLLDYIPRHGFVRADSLRLALSCLSWTLGPSVGVWLYTTYGIVAPYAWSAGWAFLLIAVFWRLGLSDGKARRPGVGRRANPLADIRRFARQPRMRLAWLIAFGRSCYWTTFYVYAPILMVATGQGKLAGGIVVSVGNAMLLLAVSWGRLGDRYGIRPVVAASFAAAALCAVAAGVAGESHPWIAAGFLLSGTLFAIGLDAVGGAPFLRAVRPLERAQMTAVYRTNLDMSDLLPALAYSVILGFTGLGGVFVALGLFCALCAWISWRHLPRSM